MKFFYLSRQPFKGHYLSKILIAENDPLLYYDEAILEKAMDIYWKKHITNGKLLFVRNTVRYVFLASKIVGKLIDQKSKLRNMYTLYTL